jgi:hypothetical protein
MRIARRVTGSGAVIFNSMKNNREFEIFIKAIWKYQWLIKPTKLTKEIIDLFYEKTQGICDLVVKLFFNVQKRVIEKNLEEINLELINKVWDSEFTLLQPMISAIKSNNKIKKMRFEDIQEIEELKPNLQENTFTKNNNYTEKQKEFEKHAVKNKKIKVSELDNEDVRKIVIEGKKNNICEYQSLKNSGIIVSLEYILGEGEKL